MFTKLTSVFTTSKCVNKGSKDYQCTQCQSIVLLCSKTFFKLHIVEKIGIHYNKHWTIGYIKQNSFFLSSFNIVKKLFWRSNEIQLDLIKDFKDHLFLLCHLRLKWFEWFVPKTVVYYLTFQATFAASPLWWSSASWPTSSEPSAPVSASGAPTQQEIQILPSRNLRSHCRMWVKTSNRRK